MPEDIARELEALERGGNTDDGRRAIRIKRMEQRRRGADSDGSGGDRPPDDGDVKYHDSAESSVEGESNTIYIYRGNTCHAILKIVKQSFLHFEI